MTGKALAQPYVDLWRGNAMTAMGVVSSCRTVPERCWSDFCGAMPSAANCLRLEDGNQAQNS